MSNNSLKEGVLKVAIFGLGRAGGFHMNSCQILPRVKLLWVFDVDKAAVEKYSAQYECKGTTNPEEPLNDPEVNAIIVATPTPSHHEFIIKGLKAGKAVLTEKPLGTEGLSEIDECYNLAKEKNLPLFVAFNRRFDPSFSQLATAVHNGEIGDLHILRTTSRDSPLPSINYLKISCGIFHDCIVHDLDMIRYISRDEPVTIYATGHSFRKEIGEINDLDTVIVTLKMRSGALCTIDISREAVYGYDQRVEAFGSNGMIQAENRHPTTTVYHNKIGSTKPPIDYSFPARYKEAYVKELEIFRDCVLNNTPVPITHKDTRHSYILSSLAEESYKQGKILEVKFDDDAMD